jgi:two-component system CheB/CheR fusion protein
VKVENFAARRRRVALTRIVSFPFCLGAAAGHPAPAAGTMNPASPRKDGPFRALVQRVLLRQYTPPAVVINPKGDILYVNGRTGRYLEPAPGLGGMNVFEMAREELRYELGAAMQQATISKDEAVADNVRVKDGGACNWCA